LIEHETSDLRLASRNSFFGAREFHPDPSRVSIWSSCFLASLRRSRLIKSIRGEPVRFSEIKNCEGLGGLSVAHKKLGQHYRYEDNGHPTQIGANYCQCGGLPLFHTCAFCLGIDKTSKQHSTNAYPRDIHRTHSSHLGFLLFNSAQNERFKSVSLGLWK
jgi:hypothetical protein